jgi:hypothetical protein
MRELLIVYILLNSHLLYRNVLVLVLALVVLVLLDVIVALVVPVVLVDGCGA